MLPCVADAGNGRRLGFAASNSTCKTIRLEMQDPDLAMVAAECRSRSVARFHKRATSRTCDRARVVFRVAATEFALRGACETAGRQPVRAAWHASEKKD
jgi:hypothetical protein